jgi:hypothetical protein
MTSTVPQAAGDPRLVNFDQSSLFNKLILKMEDCCPRENISA